MSIGSTETTTGASHSHRWRIAEPQGPTSLGTCGRCGLLREFQNYLESGDFVTNEEHRVMGLEG